MSAFYAGRMKGYMQALDDMEEKLDNANQNHHGPTEPQHYDHEIRDQIIMLRDEIKMKSKSKGKST